MQCRKALQRLVFLGASASILATWFCFPWNTDPQGDQTAKARKFYEKAYSPKTDFPNVTSVEAQPLSAKEQFYVNLAQRATANHRIPEKVGDFVQSFGLRQKKVLEVGAGSGVLQDIVPDYTALDISPTARRFFHKPFVEASATGHAVPRQYLRWIVVCLGAGTYTQS